MRSRRPAFCLALLSLAVLVPGARAETPVWVATVPIQTGAEERVEVGVDGTAWAVIDHSRVLRSTDRGVSWLPVNPVPVTGVPGDGPPSGGSSDTYVGPLTAQLAVGANGGAVSRTTDGGLTWTRVAVPTHLRDGFESTKAVKQVGGSVYLVRGGFEVKDGCAVLAKDSQFLRTRDGQSYTASPLPVVDAFVTDLAMRADGRGAVGVYDVKYRKVNNSSGCGYEGTASRSLVLTTLDAGRHWRRSTTCQGSCSLAWTSKGTLIVAGTGGDVRESRDLGLTYRALQPLPVLPQQILGVQGLDCSGERCWALVNGTGIFRRDGATEWQHEPSDADAPGVCIASLTALDHDGALTAGPHALMTRVAAPAGTLSSRAGQPIGAIRLSPRAELLPLGTLRVRTVVPLQARGAFDTLRDRPAQSAGENARTSNQPT